MVARPFCSKPYEILISDDDDECREVVREALDAEGYHTLPVASGREAIEVVRRHFVHVMIVDFNMPDMTGIETLRIIRHEVSITVPSILMSADDSRATMAKALSESVESFLPKPVDVGTLRYIVEEIIRRHYGEE